ncbi:glutathione S-transferase family protein [Roseomonas sp. M0104]|uniref:Glutathione S-transferase family protein n=1 Tax=Teichococcus coralli TaxID=2545983 RepID=A0A845BCG1_9PROT|nr:glutathione S-transferase family protein [Pseudoroseomonas coralli]MXP64388.1 glutathione S-transferase family protein [Pseudoroseomonas coralli]
MTDELVFYTHPMSRGRIVRWALEESGQPYRTEIVEYGPAMQAPGFRALNPMGKVPVLSHGGTVVTETAAICAYLADAFPAAQLAPAVEDRRRGPYYRWLFFAAGPVEAAVSNAACGFVVPEEKRAMVGHGTLAAVLDVLEGAVSRGDYLLGDRFTMADLYLGSQVGWGMMFGMVERRPAFERYWERLAARPAALRARQIDDALMAERGEATTPE